MILDIFLGGHNVEHEDDMIQTPATRHLNSPENLNEPERGQFFDVDVVDHLGRTPLMHAVVARAQEAVVWLVRRRAELRLLGVINSLVFDVFIVVAEMAKNCWELYLCQDGKHWKYIFGVFDFQHPRCGWSWATYTFGYFNALLTLKSKVWARWVVLQE